MAKNTFNPRVANEFWRKHQKARGDGSPITVNGQEFSFEEQNKTIALYPFLAQDRIPFEIENKDESIGQRVFTELNYLKERSGGNIDEHDLARSMERVLQLMTGGSEGEEYDQREKKMVGAAERWFNDNIPNAQVSFKDLMGLLGQYRSYESFTQMNNKMVREMPSDEVDAVANFIWQDEKKNLQHNQWGNISPQPGTDRMMSGLANAPPVEAVDNLFARMRGRTFTGKGIISDLEKGLEIQGPQMLMSVEALRRLEVGIGEEKFGKGGGKMYRWMKKQGVAEEVARLRHKYENLSAQDALKEKGLDHELSVYAADVRKRWDNYQLAMTSDDIKANHTRLLSMYEAENIRKELLGGEAFRAKTFWSRKENIAYGTPHLFEKAFIDNYNQFHLDGDSPLISIDYSDVPDELLRDMEKLAEVALYDEPNLTKEQLDARVMKRLVEMYYIEPEWTGIWNSQIMDVSNNQPNEVVFVRKVDVDRTGTPSDKRLSRVLGFSPNGTPLALNSQRLNDFKREVDVLGDPSADLQARGASAYMLAIRKDIDAKSKFRGRGVPRAVPIYDEQESQLLAMYIRVDYPEVMDTQQLPHRQRRVKPPADFYFIGEVQNAHLYGLQKTGTDYDPEGGRIERANLDRRIEAQRAEQDIRKGFSEKIPIWNNLMRKARYRNRVLNEQGE